MAEKIKILITSDCKIGGKHIDKGSTFEIDPDVAADKNNYALLVHAGRVAEYTEENVARLKKEIESENAFEKAQAKAQAAQAPLSIESIVAAVTAAMAKAKA
jgi:hypothetical protein